MYFTSLIKEDVLYSLKKRIILCEVNALTC